MRNTHLQKRQKTKLKKSNKFSKKALWLLLLFLTISPWAKADYNNWVQDIKIEADLTRSNIADRVKKYIYFHFTTEEWHQGHMGWAHFEGVTASGRVVEIMHFNGFSQYKFAPGGSKYGTFETSTFNPINANFGGRWVRFWPNKKFFEEGIISVKIRGGWFKHGRPSYEGEKMAYIGIANSDRWQGYSNPGFYVKENGGRSRIEVSDQLLQDETGKNYFEVKVPYAYTEGAFGFLDAASLWYAGIKNNGDEYGLNGKSILYFQTNFKTKKGDNFAFEANNGGNYGEAVRKNDELSGNLKKAVIWYYPNEAFIQHYYSLKNAHSSAVKSMGFHYEGWWSDGHYNSYEWKKIDDYPTLKFPYISGIEISPNKWNKSIQLKWDATFGEVDKNAKWCIFRKDLDANGNLLPGSAMYIGEVGIDARKFTHTHSTAKPVIGGKKYRYIVCYVRNSWAKKDQPTVTQLTKDVFFNPDLKFTLYRGEMKRKSIGLKISHEKLEKGTYNYELVRKGSDGSSKTIKSLTFSDKTETIYTDKDAGLKNCVNYTYQLKTGLILDKNFTSNELAGTAIGGTLATDLDISKGEYPGKTTLKWYADKTFRGNEFYTIQRRVAETEDAFEEIDEIYSKDKFLTYTDDKVNPNIYYEYRIKVRPDTAGCKTLTLSYSDIGFAQSKGMVSGTVSYGTGIGVENVEVGVFRKDTANGAQQFKSLKLNRKGGRSGLKMNMDKTKANRLFAEGNFSVQMWLQPTEIAGKFPLISTDKFQLYLSNETTLNLKIGTKEKQVSIGRLSPTEFSHLNFVKNGNTYSVFVVQKDGKIQQFTFPNGLAAIEKFDTLANIYFGSHFDATSNAYQGYIDEIRVWSKALNTKDISKTYGRMLSGDEKGLEVYLPIDEGLSTMTFDISSKNGMKNNHHCDILHGSTSSTKIPDKNQFGLYGLTDENGAYLIRGISFVGSGNTFDIQPSYGMHKFSPNKKTLFISNQSLNHNKIDFTDISSFNVSGKITYKGTNIPVQGVSFAVDNNTCLKDGRVIETDNNGNYTISVPIGKHSIKVFKHKHTFENGGRYPAQANVLKNFDRKITNLNFEDNTLVTLTGRVSGGEIQKEQPHGLLKGKANIGQAKLTLKLDLENEGYVLNTDTKNKRDFYSSSDSIKSEAAVKAHNGGAAKELVIKTDATTGEFAVKLPPVKFLFKEVELLNDTENISPKIEVKDKEIDLRDVKISKIDSAKNTVDTSKYDAFNYHTAFDVIYKKDKPTIEVEQIAIADKGAFGLKEFKIEDESGREQSIEIYKVKSNDTIAYNYTYPVYKQGDTCSFKIKAYELYTNYDGNTAVYDKVPLKEKKLTIQNNFSSVQEVFLDSGKFENNDVKRGEIYKEKKEGFKLGKNGECIYKFTVGFPNINDDFKLPFNLKVDDKHSWDGNFHAIVLGTLQGGSNFVTAGPDKVQMILRDPPGTNSSAFIEKGSTVTSTKNISASVTGSYSKSLGFNVGITNKIMIGAFGIGRMMKIKLNATQTVGFDISATVSTSGEFVETVTTTERISTSSDPEYVGAAGDVFIGTSTNLVFGDANSVAFVKDGEKGYKLQNKPTMTASSQFSTAFKFTEYYIENHLMPNLEKIRNNNLVTVSQAEYDTYKSGSKKNNTDKPIFLTTLNAEDEKFGSNNFDREVWGEKAIDEKAVFSKESDVLFGPSYMIVRPQKGDRFSDTIRYCNEQVKNWKKILSKNEKDKLTAIRASEKWLDKNHSFEGGSSVESSLQTCSSKSGTIGGSFSASVFYSTETGLTIDDFGATINTETRLTGEVSGSITEQKENCVTTGYTLAETDNDAITVDVYKSPANYGAIFRTRGGQTSCPYEGEVKTKYYEPGTEIATATSPIEVPYLLVENTDVTGAPSGGVANYTIRVSNNTTVNEEAWFVLSVIDATNPNGAKITMDGQSIKGGIRLFVEPGKTLVKKLQLRQTDLALLDYQNITIRLASACQNDPGSNNPVIASDVNISAKFIPSCTALELVAKNNVANLKNPVFSSQIKGYDPNYKGLQYFELQMRGMGENDWRKIKRYFINDTIQGYNAQKDELISKTGDVMPIDVNMKDRSDKKYQFRVISQCTFGDYEGRNESEVVEVIKDTYAPQVLGKTNPVSGVLSSEDEISVLFNEDIKTSALTSSNFSVKGILNAHKIQHSTALKFQGNANSKATTEARMNLGQKDFTAEMWIKYYGEAGTLFETGNNDGHFKVAIDSDKKMLLTIGDKVYKSDKELITDRWMYLAFAYDYDQEKGSTFTANYAYDAETVNLFNATTVANYKGNGTLSIGEGLKASIHELSLWNRTRDFGERAMYNTKTPSTVNLIGYWAMNEGYGTLAIDAARSRNLTLSAASLWHLENVNKAIELSNQQYLKKDISQLATSVNEDYAIEIWFKGNPKAEKSMLFASDDSILSVGFDASGHLFLIAKNKVYKAKENVNYLDGQWHHLALNVLFSGNADIYIDGNSKLQVSSKNMPLFGGALLTIGAGHYKNELNNGFNYSYFFEGAVDELRIWKAHKTIETIRLNSYNQPKLDEVGLVAYYPFEKKTKDSGGQIEVVGSLENPSDSTVLTLSGGEAKYTELSAPIKEARAETELRFNFVASERKVVLNINEEAERIENCTLTFTVKDVSDSYNNYITPVVWSAYVSQNRLKWSEKEIKLTKEVLKEKQFSLSISNQSGAREKWNISHLPSWLSTRKTKGELNPLSSQEIEFTVLDNAPIGNYDETIYLTGSNHIDEPLLLNLKVTGQKPAWKVLKNESSMNAVGQLQIEGIPSQDADDLVAAFVDDVCVGMASPKYYKRYDTYIVTIDIYGNSQMQGKEVVFKAWDASTGKIYPKLDAGVLVKYKNNDLYGTFDKPLVWNTLDLVEQIIYAEKGWNWLSVNALTNDMTVGALFSPIKENTSLVKNKTNFTVPYQDAWSKGLDSIKIGSMYKVNMAKNSKLKVMGKKVNPKEAPINIEQNWNWIGYTPQFVLPVGAALSDLNPQNGDIVKSQSQFAIFTGYEWMGSLKTMAPGKGYLYQSKAKTNKSFTYPSKPVVAPNKSKKATRTTTFKPIDKNLYPGNMTIVGVVMKEDEVMPNVEVGVFAKDECRAAAFSDEKGYVFLTVLGEEKVALTFKVKTEEQTKEINQNLSYADDAMIGNTDNPYQIVYLKTGIENEMAHSEKVEIYPTFFTDYVNVKVKENTLIHKIEVKDVNGKVLLVENNAAEFNKLIMSNLNAGVYFIVVETNQGTFVEKVVK